MARKLQPLYGIAMQQAAESGDLDEMKALAERAERHLAADGDVADALETLKAEIAKTEAGSDR
ncbi:MAG: hypothetical protein QOK16_4620 [Solirubrobacteraceae bacterium]|jgi:hypothetical protein|nr:hypothetical protein [Solirubrobacteraceae bacterium]MEA2184278.1 hypothetical protein [Solirubrobacteraceae bacterium]MEA2189609.1 hypothetical protein [Solirubrobacteraceae bacterium]MEA2383498.1 hypothetical protein [Solirubrobacteraceae bacterium]